MLTEQPSVLKGLTHCSWPFLVIVLYIIDHKKSIWYIPKVHKSYNDYGFLKLFYFHVLRKQLMYTVSCTDTLNCPQTMTDNNG